MDQRHQIPAVGEEPASRHRPLWSLAALQPPACLSVCNHVTCVCPHSPSTTRTRWPSSATLTRWVPDSFLTCSSPSGLLTDLLLLLQELINRAIELSVAARKQWDLKPVQDRAQVLLKAADLLSGPRRAEVLAKTMIGQVRPGEGGGAAGGRGRR